MVIVCITVNVNCSVFIESISLKCFCESKSCGIWNECLNFKITNFSDHPEDSQLGSFGWRDSATFVMDKTTDPKIRNWPGKM